MCFKPFILLVWVASFHLHSQSLKLPKLEGGEPLAGNKVKIITNEYMGTEVFHTLYLPPNWTQNGAAMPIIFEYTGNQYYATGSSGKVEDAALGFGLSNGKFIWVTLPYISTDGTKNQRVWWGDVNATVSYAKENVPKIIKQYNADKDQIYLAGFSRGAIAVNFIGLFDNEIAELWSGFITHDHFDGAKEWPRAWGAPLTKYRANALKRLVRVKGRPYLVIQNGDVSPAQEFVQNSLTNTDNFTFMSISTTSIFGEFPNDIASHSHTDKWLLLPSSYKDQVQNWFHKVINN